MKFFTSVYILIFLCILALILGGLLLVKLVHILTINKLAKGKDRSASYICDLLCERFPKSKTFVNVHFLDKEAEENGLKTTCDLVYISKGGVLLLTVFKEIGVYDNPKIGKWRHRYLNKQKETVTLDVENPFDSMAFFSGVAEKLLMNENVLNPSVSRAVVFSADLVDYTTEYPECLTVGTLFDYVEAFDRRCHFNKKEFEAAVDTISACSEFLEYKQNKKIVEF